MFARSISIHLKPNSVAEFTRLIEKEALPLLRKQKGFRNEITFAVPGGAERRLHLSPAERGVRCRPEQRQDTVGGVAGPQQGGAQRVGGGGGEVGSHLRDPPSRRRGATLPPCLSA